MARSASVIVENEVGLHARPASLFVQTAKKYNSIIKVSKGEQDADAKSILDVLGLGVECGDKIEIETDGLDEKEAIKALVELVKQFEEF